ncbi:MAG: adenylate/guanylate cyclase domain-containing protein [Gammaproteobacteria bacterium]|jgi:adenylate cyclase
MHRIRVWGLGVIAGLMILEFGGLHFLRTADWRLQDAMQHLHASPAAANSDLTVINIDERSLALMAPDFGRYPWPRSVHARLLEGILAQKPRAVVFDILFSDPQIEHPDADQYLSEVAASSEHTYFPMVWLPDSDAPGLPLARYGRRLGFTPGPDPEADAQLRAIAPIEGLTRTGRIGAINFLEDPDGIGRRYWVNIPVGGWDIPSLPWRVGRDLGFQKPPGDSIILNWKAPPYAYRTLSFADVFRDMERRQPHRPADEFRDKIVVIGSTASELHDLRATPMGSETPGVYILTTALANLAEGDWLTRAPVWLAPLLAVVLLVFLGLAFARRTGPFPIGAILGALTVIWLVAAYAFLAGGGVLVPVIQPLAFAWLFFVATALLDYLRERNERKHAVRMFGRFLDPRVVAELVGDDGPRLDTRGRNTEITVLFSDIRGFTSLSETRPPEQVLDLLNRYFSRQVEVIFRHGGTIDKFIGDAIMAFWGAPLADTRQADNAIRAATEMIEVLEAFRGELTDLDQGFDIGIGIHTGPAVVGFIGAEHRMDYTAIGDTVNLASRIEGQTKGVARILVSEATRARCADGFDFRDHGSYKVKGREKPVRLFEPVFGERQ